MGGLKCRTWGVQISMGINGYNYIIYTVYIYYIYIYNYGAGAPVTCFFFLMLGPQNYCNYMGTYPFYNWN